MRGKILYIAIIFVVALSSCFNGKRVKIKRVEAWVNMMPTFDSTSSRKGHILITFDIPEKFKGLRDSTIIKSVEVDLNGDRLNDPLIKWDFPSINEFHIYNIELQPGDTVKAIVTAQIKGKDFRVSTPKTVVKAVY